MRHCRLFMPMGRSFWFAVFAALALFPATALGSSAVLENSRTDFVLGTLCSIRIIQGPSPEKSKALLDAAFARLRGIEESMSANKSGTELDRVNQAAGVGAVKVDDDVWHVLSTALRYARLSDGAFDPTIGPLVKLWGIGTEAARLPSRPEIVQALGLVDWTKVRLDDRAKSVKLERRGMRLDLGAIAKGYAADEMKRILLSGGVKAAIVDLGGNVLALGQKQDGKPWRIGVQDPGSDRGEYLGILEGRDFTVVTSGVYERFFEFQGKHYHHILDTLSGFPVDNGLVSVTVAATSSIDADALSTTLFALGRERGMALAAGMDGVAVVMVDASNLVHMNKAAEKIFQLTSAKYKRD